MLLQQIGHNAVAEETEVTKVLESLVADNENLKHDNAELQNLLTEAREDVHALQEEVEESRAAFLSGPRGGGNIIHTSRQNFTLIHSRDTTVKTNIYRKYLVILGTIGTYFVTSPDTLLIFLTRCMSLVGGPQVWSRNPDGCS